MTGKSKEFILKQMTMMADDRFDAEIFGKSATFEGILGNHECMMTYPDEQAPEVIAYWRKKGLTKELHGAGTGKLCDKWASYLPNELADGAAGDKTYPLLFVMHGSGNPIYLAESYGYTQIAAREQWIVIIPEDETAESIDRLFRYAKEHYPVDWSRVYMVGYSLGGYMTSRHALRWPERFAAVGVGGMLFANGYAIPEEQGGKLWEGETLTPEMVEHAARYGVPACISMGEYEVLGLLPVTQDERKNEWTKHLDEEKQKGTGEQQANSHARTERIDLSGKNKIASINNWRKINGCALIAEEDVRNAAHETADIVVEKIGFPFERTMVETREKRTFYIGDSPAQNGDCALRVIGVAKAPHWISQAQADLTWEFISRFSVDPETGKSYRRQEK